MHYLRRRHHGLVTAVSAGVVCAILLTHFRRTPGQEAQAVSSRVHQVLKTPTFYTVDVKAVNEGLAACAGYDTEADDDDLSQTYGDLVAPLDRASPWHARDPGPYAIDVIFADRMKTLPHLAAADANAADFVYLPLRMLDYNVCRTQGSGDAKAAALSAAGTAIRQALERAAGVRRYPSVLIVLPRIRHDYEFLFNDDLLAKHGDDIVLAGIEGDTWTMNLDVAAFIQIPYTSRFRLPHLYLPDPLQTPAIPASLLHAHARPDLVLFAGRSSGDYPTETPFNGMAARAAMYEELTAASATDRRIVLVDDPMQDLDLLYEKMWSSTFCLEPAGDSSTRRGFYDAVFTGCIPVITRLSSYDRLFSPDVAVTSFALHIPEDEIVSSAKSYLRPNSMHRLPTLVERLESVPRSRVEELQAGMRKVAPLLQWSVPEDAIGSGESVWSPGGGVAADRGWSRDAFGMTLRQLARVRDGTFGRGRT